MFCGIIYVFLSGETDIKNHKKGGVFGPTFLLNQITLHVLVKS